MEYDKIYIKDLLVRCIVGINEDERVKKQDVLINITLYTDFTVAAASDDISTTVDYKKLKLKIMEFTEQSSFLLIERLVSEIAELCLENPLVAKAKVLVEKPTALRFARSVGVEVVRSRKQ